MKVKIEKLVFGGQGLCRSEGKVIFVWGGLPGEEVEIKIIKKKKNFIEGVVEKVLVPSPDRLLPLDDHYLSCSPWQTMSYAKENEWKKIIAEETYRRIGNFESGILNLEIVVPKKEIGYRNKLEYNFALNSSGELSLAFHDRGTHRLHPIESCILGTEIIQNASEEIVDNLRKHKVPFQTLKSLIVRSDDSDRAVAGLFVKYRDFVKKFGTLGSGTEGKPHPASPWEGEGALKGLQIYYSNPLSPASVPTELLYSNGETELWSILNGVKLKFGLLSFFQINPPIFEEALKVIGNHIDGGPAQSNGGGRIVDYYSGVGAISLALHGRYSEALLIEENREAVEFAEKNIKLNNFNNVTITNNQAENANADIGESDIVLLDPPRAGLHSDMIKHLLKKLPRKIIYLSCGLDTHARDIASLSVRYRPVEWKLFNFFPRTPHIEGLCILERI